MLLSMTECYFNGNLTTVVIVGVQSGCFKIPERVAIPCPPGDAGMHTKVYAGRRSVRPSHPVLSESVRASHYTLSRSFVAGSTRGDGCGTSLLVEIRSILRQ